MSPAGPSSSRPLRVCVDLTEVRPGGETGGAKYLVFEFLRHIGAKYPGGFRWIFITSPANHAEIWLSLARMDDEVICLADETEAPELAMAGGLPRQSVRSAAEIGIALERGADLLYFPFCNRIAHVPGIPTVRLVVDLLHRDYPFTLSATDLQAREQHFDEAMRTTDVFQCISRFSMQRLHDEYGVPTGRMFATYIPIQHRLHVPEEKAALPPSAGSGRPPGPFFYYPANFWKHKNHEILLLAYRLYARRAGDAAWPLVLTGHPDRHMERLAKLAQDLEIASLVHFRGYVAEDELHRLWKAAGAMVFPSLHEGFGIPLVEAMHYGVPIVAGELYSIPEICGPACLYADVRRPEALADALGRIAGDAALRAKLAAEGRDRLSLFCLDREVDNLVGAFRAAAARWPRFGCRGIGKEGWVAGDAILALPELAGRVRLSIELEAALPAARLVCWAGAKPLGSFDGVDVEGGRIEASFRAPERHLRFRVLRRPDSAADQGVRIRRIELKEETGELHALWPLSS